MIAMTMNDRYNNDDSSGTYAVEDVTLFVSSNSNVERCQNH